ncbi:MAG: glycoside hydrolase family 3 protein [Deltaproteobacteria bacterium]|nr:glycoside hydrolase family 3 protein [Deltaproteobacteria bacterium]
MNYCDFTNEQIAGQMIIAGFYGTKPDDELKFLINTIKAGGVILFSRNIESRHQLEDLCSSIQRYAKQAGQPPLFIAIDQEGGKVARLKEPFTIFSGAPYIKTPEQAEKFAEITGEELKRTGINMNMAPVLDIAPENFENSAMAGRMFCGNPEQAGELGAEVIRGLQKKNVISVAKHFPGIGRATVDSHFKLPNLIQNRFALDSFELIPFKAAINVKAAGIMTSHVIYPKIDALWPAGLSRKIITNILRTELGYDGLVITDDLDMGAIDKYYDLDLVIDRILTVETDIALICKNTANIKKAFDLILDFIKSSPFNKARCKRSLQRIIKTKTKYLA